MSFFFSHSADSILSALDRGMAVDEFGLSNDYGDAAALLGENFRALEDYTATQAATLLTGTLDGAGAAAVPHLIGDPFGLLSVQAWCKGATATDFAPVAVDSVDATNVNLSGGTAGAAVRVFVQYSIVPPGW